MEAARQVGADENEAAFKAKLAQIARQKVRMNLMAEKLTKPLWRGLKVLSLAHDRLEPIELWASVSSEVADNLVAMGLAERGESDPRFEEWGYPVGYRLTSAGRYARHYKGQKPKADVPEPPTEAKEEA